MPQLVPCTATATSFLYAVQNSVVCCCRETLAFVRLFGRHSDTVSLLVSSCTRQLVVSCDGSAAIVWDPESGEEKSRCMLPERITAAAWMESGIVVFGSCLGKLFLFNPNTATYDYKSTLDQEITAVAPAYVSDSLIFAVGYRNGSLLLYKVNLEIEVVYNMSYHTSPIAGLSWHASHPFLAMHDANGNLSTWRIGHDQPTERRIAERREEQSSHCWMGWSKQGRLVHYRDRQTYSWDVRGPVLERVPISVPGGVVGMSIDGPRARLFTLGDDRTVRLLNLTSGCILASRRHPQILPAARPLVVCDALPAPSLAHRGSIASINSDAPSRASTEITVMFSAASVKEWDSDSDGNESSVTDLASVIASSIYSDAWPSSPFSHEDDGQLATTGGSVTLSTTSLPEERDLLGNSPPHLGSTPPSSDDGKVEDLFPSTRSRMLRARFSRGRAPAAGTRAGDQIQILAVMFDWAGTVVELVESEIGRAASYEPRRTMLAGWLDGLGTFGGIASDDVNAKQQLAYDHLRRGDLHSATSLLLSARLHRQAVGMYEAAGLYMEAMIASLLFVPSWGYQSGLLAKWASAEKEARPELSRRCFLIIQEAAAAPPPPQLSLGQPLHCSPQRNLVKKPPLRLVTSFGVSSGSICPSSKALSAHPGTRSTHMRNVESSFSSVPKTAIEDTKKADQFSSNLEMLPSTRFSFDTPSRGRGIVRMVSRWKRKINRDSGDYYETPAPVTAYKDDSSLLGNVI